MSQQPFAQFVNEVEAGSTLAAKNAFLDVPDFFHQQRAVLLVGDLDLDELSGGRHVLVGALDRVVARDSVGELEAGRSGTRHYGLNGEARQEDLSVFIESFAPPPHLVIFGAVDFTAALMRVAKFLGFRVTVCDARPVFATRQRFPLADDVVVDWPNRQ